MNEQCRYYIADLSSDCEFLFRLHRMLFFYLTQKAETNRKERRRFPCFENGDGSLRRISNDAKYQCHLAFGQSGTPTTTYSSSEVRETYKIKASEKPVRTILYANVPLATDTCCCAHHFCYHI